MTPFFSTASWLMCRRLAARSGLRVANGQAAQNRHVVREGQLRAGDLSFPATETSTHVPTRRLVRTSSSVCRYIYHGLSPVASFPGIKPDHSPEGDLMCGGSLRGRYGPAPRSRVRPDAPRLGSSPHRTFTRQSIQIWGSESWMTRFV